MSAADHINTIVSNGDALLFFAPDTFLGRRPSTLQLFDSVPAGTQVRKNTAMSHCLSSITMTMILITDWSGGHDRPPQDGTNCPDAQVWTAPKYVFVSSGSPFCTQAGQRVSAAENYRSGGQVGFPNSSVSRGFWSPFQDLGARSAIFWHPPKWWGRHLVHSFPFLGEYQANFWKLHILCLSGALLPLPRTPNFKWLAQWHLWVYKFENCFLGSPNHPEHALQWTKKSQFFFHRLQGSFRVVRRAQKPSFKFIDP